MKKMLSLIAVAALLMPNAGMYAAQARMKQAREAVAKNTKKLSEWTGDLLSKVGRAIGRQRYDKIAGILKKHKKKAAGITGAAVVLGAVALILRFFPRTETTYPTAGEAAIAEKGKLGREQAALTAQARERARAARQATARAEAREQAGKRGQRRGLVGMSPPGQFGGTGPLPLPGRGARREKSLEEIDE